ncbi:LOW QUALITY PROTEIN: Plant methyltransferase dimerization [Dillenia turbinata]|uniref:Plant methyltransferase dimerization n=1 Tax=Dillenia turbinata TaxID=194707 RepID=A0AAN8UVZ3_9MAGN
MEITDASSDTESTLEGQAEIWQIIVGYMDSMTVKSVVELRIPDIIHSHNSPITLSQIAAEIESTGNQVDLTCLVRIMRLLVRKKIFTAQTSSDGGEMHYGLTNSSRWLLHGSQTSFCALATISEPSMDAPWHLLSRCVKEGGSAFEKAHGGMIWDLASANPEFNEVINDAMACVSKNLMKAGGFGRVGSLVDVGGGSGWAVAQVAKTFQYIKCFNLDLPHVIAASPAHEGVTHLCGDMFDVIPPAHAIFMKRNYNLLLTLEAQSVMHDWSDQDCVKILKNCLDIVLRPDGDGLFDDTNLALGLAMRVQTSGGKERTEEEWKKVLEEGGFPRYNIIQIPTLQSIIEAFPN